PTSSSFEKEKSSSQHWRPHNPPPIHARRVPSGEDGLRHLDPSAAPPAPETPAVPQAAIHPSSPPPPAPQWHCPQTSLASTSASRDASSARAAPPRSSLQGLGSV